MAKCLYNRTMARVAQGVDRPQSGPRHLCELRRPCCAALQSLHAGVVLQQRVPARSLEDTQAFMCTAEHAFSCLDERSTDVPCMRI